MSTFGPAAETQKRFIELFRADPVLMTPNTGLLFPPYQPQINGDDLRVYPAAVELPENPDLREALPRVLVETVSFAHDYEQTPTILEGPVTMYTHVVVPKEDEERGELIDARLATLIASTRASDARIIAADFVPYGQRQRERIPAFNGAWEIVSGYRSRNVGVLV